VLNPNGGSAMAYWVALDAVVQRTDVSRRSRSDFINYYTRPSNLLLLFGAVYSWFAIDGSSIPFIGGVVE